MLYCVASLRGLLQVSNVRKRPKVNIYAAEWQRTTFNCAKRECLLTLRLNELPPLPPKHDTSRIIKLDLIEVCPGGMTIISDDDERLCSASRKTTSKVAWL